MRAEIDLALQRGGGVASRRQLLAVVSRTQLDSEIRSGKLTRLFPHTFCRPRDADLAEIARRAALVSAGRRAALSHVTALGRWCLPCGLDNRVHIIVPESRSPRPRHTGMVVHHVGTPYPPVVRHTGLLTVSAAAAVAQSWPLLSGSDQRAPFLVGRRDKLLTTDEVRRELARSTRLAGRAQLIGLADLIDAGCESELELWGYLNVFDVDGLRHADRQRWLTVRGRRYRGDLIYDEERLLVELDGRKYHAEPEQWERDTARDLALATIGWQTVRLSHRRLTTDVAGCRRDVLAVLASRRQVRKSS